MTCSDTRTALSITHLCSDFIMCTSLLLKVAVVAEIEIIWAEGGLGTQEALPSVSVSFQNQKPHPRGLDFLYGTGRRRGLNTNLPALYLCSAAGKRVSTGYIQLQGAVGGKREGFRQNQANFNSGHISA